MSQRKYFQPCISSHGNNVDLNSELAAGDKICHSCHFIQTWCAVGMESLTALATVTVSVWAPSEAPTEAFHFSQHVHCYSREGTYEQRTAHVIFQSGSTWQIIHSQDWNFSRTRSRCMQASYDLFPQFYHLSPLGVNRGSGSAARRNIAKKNTHTKALELI